MQLTSLLMQNSSTCSRFQLPTVPLSLRVRVPMLMTLFPEGPTPPRSQARPPHATMRRTAPRGSFKVCLRDRLSPQTLTR